MRNIHRTISRRNLPKRLPISFGILMYLFLDKLQVSQVVWGVSITLYILLFILVVYIIVKEQTEDVWTQEKTKS